MKALVRWAIVILLLACLVLASRIVTCLNSETGSWAMLVLLCALPLAFVSLRHVGRKELVSMVVIALGMAALHIAVMSTATWRLTIRIDGAERATTWVDEQRYAQPTIIPSRIPMHGINDHWSIRTADDTPTYAIWWNGSDREVVNAPLKAFFEKRPLVDDGNLLPLLTLLALSILLLAVWVRAFAHGLPPLPELIRSRAGTALTFLLGVLCASAISPPPTWLSNEFLSRPDDWLCYEGAARALSNGDLFLSAPLGGVEMWSLLYPAVLAVLHGLLGPAMAPIHIVQFATNLLLVPLTLLLVRSSSKWFQFAIIAAALLFVLVDINMNYAWHLLSDVLPLLLMTGLLVAIQQQKDVRLIALLCGLLYLQRVELIGVGVLVFGMFLLDRERATRADRLNFLLIYGACLLPYFVRWFMIHGNLRPFPIAMGHAGQLPLDEMLTVEHMYMKLRVLLGDCGLFNHDQHTRYHWFALHAVFAGALGYVAIKRRFDRMLAITVILFTYVLATRMMSPSVGIYGHRHSLLSVLLEAIFILLVLDRTLFRTKSG
ncbi:MAG: hypothetical protein IPG69_11225 [Flavobacteriales bacterium]|nr:hypothetical protein [Flavobacteriales bacterium]